MGLGSGIRKKPIPDPGVKKAPDPGSATLKHLLFIRYLNESKADRHGFWTGGEVGQQPHYRGQHLPVGRLSLASCIRFRSESVPFLIIMFNSVLYGMFLGLLDPDLLVRGTDPDPDPSIIKQK
jgi:hypothetical protein